ncbi:AAA family ATPase [Nitrospirillum iridis]|uniref:ATP-dependent Zn protease n=1 Tax=Nitrospirillum iridis TaxID=765888 RepID=A0A7X0AWL4_9PROT|nr:AAA family ATPase [Nitrospirillum iridis]MBB6251467.1 ATP-dependent Zn protease [Nitrospirillum iridis]
MAFDPDEFEAHAPVDLETKRLDFTAVEILFEQSAEDHPGLREAALRSGCLVTVEVPGDAWIEAAEAAVPAVLERWFDLAPVPAQMQDGSPAGTAAACRATSPRWTVVNRNSAGQLPAHASAHVAKALSAGAGAVLVLRPGEALPARLAAITDYRLELPAFTWAVVEELVGAVAPGASLEAELPDGLCAALEPEDFRLMARPGEEPDRWIDRLRAIAQSRIATSKPASGPTLDDLHGMDGAVEWGRNLARDLAEYKAGRRPWAEVDQRCLLAGPPGTGKTTFASALAKSCDVPLIMASHAEWQSTGHQGDMLRSMAATFDMAERTAPCIVLIEEIDSFPSRIRPDGNDTNSNYNRQTGNALQLMLDKASRVDGVVVIATTNHPGMLDPALLRAGRLDRTIEIGLPDNKALAEILRLHIGQALSPGVDLAGLMTTAVSGSTGADCVKWARGAKRRARAAGKLVGLAELQAEIPRREEVGLPPGVAQRVAVHKAGHAVAMAALFPGALASVNMPSAGVAGAGMAGLKLAADICEPLPTAPMLLDRVRVSLAGRIAEGLLLDAPGMDAGGGEDSDLATATLTVIRMLRNGGLGAHLTWIGAVTPASVGPILRADPALASQVERLLKTEFLGAHALISRHRKAVEAVAELLMQRGAVSGEIVERILATSAANAGGNLQ